MKLIAESAWHHEGDFSFFSDLVRKILQSDASDILKFHLSLNIEEYASPNHPWYEIGKRNLFSLIEWTEIFEQVKRKRKELLLLYNDQQSIEFGSSFNPEFVEIHSVALNDIFLWAGTKISSFVLGFRAFGLALVGFTSKIPKFLISILIIS